MLIPFPIVGNSLTIVVLSGCNSFDAGVKEEPLVIETNLLLCWLTIHTCDVPPVSTIVTILTAVDPEPIPTGTCAVPFQTYNTLVAVSHQRSPVTLVLAFGSVALATTWPISFQFPF